MNDEKNTLLSKLNEMEDRYVEIERQIAVPATATNPGKVIALSKEQGKLRPVVEKYREYKSTQAAMAEAELMLAGDSADEDLKLLAREELQQLENKKSRLTDELQNTLVMADELSVRSVIMEIRAGTGGEEAALFARDLYNMYVKYAGRRRWKVEELDFSPTEKGGFREIIFGVKGDGAWSDLGMEAGGHRVQRVPQTESQGRIHTSAATVAVLPEPEEVDIQINHADVVESVSRAGGPGGQNVNKVSSAIRLEHIPTGITVNMREESSQHKNRAKAWRVLRGRIYDLHEGKKRAERDLQRKTMIGSGDRSEKIRTYNFPQNRLTDHRVNLSLYNLDKIMTGDMDVLISSLKQYSIQQKLKNL
jgi:peptide chain release factor 1